MLGQEGLNLPVPEDLAPRLDAEALRAARAFYSKLFEWAAAIAVPHGGRVEITVVDSAVRSRTSGK